MKVLKGQDPSAIKEAGRIIREGGIVVFPTETVYGLGADAFNPQAVARVFEVKKRPFFDPLIVHVKDPKDLEELCEGVDQRAKKLIERFWPGPLTLVLPKKDKVPDIVTSGLKTVAVRMPSHPIALSLIRDSQTFIAAPSANSFGKLSPTRVEHVLRDIGDKVDLILDGGPCEVGVESTILALYPRPTLLRPGGIPREEIERLIGKLESHPSREKPLAPGELPKHYSPHTPLRIIREGEKIPEGLKIGLLAFKRPREGPFWAVEVLSEKGDLREAASRFFEALHRLDQLGLDLILAEPLPEEGLGLAIMDRLRKAEGEREA
jgi:L-threonylcarbamoyladenylate synthase